MTFPKEEQRRRAVELRALHDGPGIFVVPNCWDVISARVYEEAGFGAVATSSAALANALGFPDGYALDTQLHLATLTRIAAALRCPLSADVENGYGRTADDVAAFVGALVETGVAGFNLEDARSATELFDLDEAIARLRAARAAAPGLFLNARTDIFLNDIGDEATRLERTIERLRAFADAGADGVFVPGVTDEATIGTLAAAVPLPLNVLAGPEAPPAAKLQELGVRRVSVGSWPMRRILGVLRGIARELREAGTFGFTREETMAYAEANALVGAPR
ncbi:MAG TPA: isocitrate lyase/phosphoenolpyruvate mutase family protein [Candidatus Elarobacter sp.]|jgi:2-methylisocitrate lyase-like PEP mutase family enzyme